MMCRVALCIVAALLLGSISAAHSEGSIFSQRSSALKIVSVSASTEVAKR